MVDLWWPSQGLQEEVDKINLNWLDGGKKSHKASEQEKEASLERAERTGSRRLPVRALRFSHSVMVVHSPCIGNHMASQALDNKHQTRQPRLQGFPQPEDQGFILESGAPGRVSCFKAAQS